MPNLHVLLIEDDPALSDVMRDVLESDGHVVRSERDLRAARARLASERFDVMITDHWIEGMPCEPLLTELAAAADAPSVIVCSASPSVRDVASRFDVYFLAKPFDIDRLLSLVLEAGVRRRRPSQP